MSTPETPTPTTSDTEFSPPEVAEGYTRLVTPSIDVGPGGDELYCQYIMAPVDRDMDVIDITGYQSKFGHHSVAYAVKSDTPIGTSRHCNREDNTIIGGFLGGVGGEAGGKAQLPPGMVFRLAKGSGIMVNTHFLNTSEEAAVGQTVLDIKLEEADPDRQVATLMTNLVTDFTVAPQARTTADAKCTLPRDFKVVSFSNHMHNYGSTAYTDLEHADGTVERVHEDPTWSNDMQFSPVFTDWTLEAPLEMKAGDVLHTHCEWQNGTSTPWKFPDEMCVGIAFVAAEGKATSPICIGGQWME